MSDFIARMEAHAPKWALGILLIASFGLNGLLGSVSTALLVDKFTLIERSKNTKLEDKVNQISELTAKNDTRLRQLDDLVQKLLDRDDRNTKMLVELTVELRTMNDRLKRKGL